MSRARAWRRDCSARVRTLSIFSPVVDIVEVWIFGLGYYVAEHGLSLGEIIAADRDWFDDIYYSAVVYTTVGFGDLLPTGPLRMITATEALAGLSLITRSASFTFLQMQRIWRA